MFITTFYKLYYKGFIDSHFTNKYFIAVAIIKKRDKIKLVVFKKSGIIWIIIVFIRKTNNNKKVNKSI